MKTRFSKSILVLAAASLLGAGSAFAGNGDGDCDGSGSCDGSGGGGGGQAKAQLRDHGGPAERMARMANRLNLSLEQQVRALELFDLQAQDRQALRAQMFEQFGDDICAQRDQHRAEFRALLTEEQLAEHDKAMLKRRDRSGVGGLECPND